MPAFRSRRRPWVFIGLLLVLAGLFVALGNWQVQRLAWKEALIARVARVTTGPPLPFAALPGSPPAALEYRRVVLTGRYVPASTTLVTAITDLGSGYWAMTVLRPDHGPGVWINRGFVPTDSRAAQVAARVPLGPTTVTGLVRLAEPHGTWLRTNQPGTDRWYSRDPPAMASARHMAGIAPRTFIDAQSESPSPTAGAPVPGLTVLTFPNNHLSYAVTWFALALMSIGGAVVVWRRPA